MAFSYVLKKADSTVLLTLVADSNLRNPAEKQRRQGEVFSTPEGPFVQYADEVQIGLDEIEVTWRVTTPAQVQTLRDTAAGVNGDELKLGNPYEADINVAVVPGPRGFEPRRYPGTPASELSSVIMRFVRLS